MSLLSELKRRNVFRMAALYLGSAWLVMQVVDLLIDRGPLPESLGPIMLIVLAVGFPIALAISWFYEITPEGIRLDEEVRPAAAAPTVGRHIDFVIIAVLAAAVLLFAWDKWWTGPPQERSVAVLPFVNMSADDGMEFLGAGIADAILNKLVTVPELHVTSRTSSFQGRLEGLSVPEIAALLGVSVILEGSVQRQGDRLNITAQLIDAESDNHLWSKSFNRDYGDIFVVQDEIAKAVTSALELSLLEDSRQRIDREGTDNLQAYEEYSRAIDNLRKRTNQSVRLAIRQLHRAIEFDPDFARAHAVLGYVYLCAPVETGTRDMFLCSRDGHTWSELDRLERERRAREAADAALEIAPGMSTALALLGHLADDYDIKGQLFREAVENGPNDIIALHAYAPYLFLFKFEYAEATELARRLVMLDPLDENSYRLLCELQAMAEDLPGAMKTIAQGKAKIPGSLQLTNKESLASLLLGDYRGAIVAKYETLAIDPLSSESRRELGMMYLGIGMPDEAEAWFDRARAIAPEKERDQYRLMHQAAMDVYFQRNDEEVFTSLQQWLAEFPYMLWDYMSLPGVLFLEYGKRVDRFDEVLEWYKAMAPNLFETPPRDLVANDITWTTGLTLLLNGDMQRGELFVRPYLEYRQKAAQAGGHVSPSMVITYLALGETGRALEQVRAIAARSKFHGSTDMTARVLYRHSSLFEPLRKEPEFMALLEEYDRNAAEQRQQLKSMSDQLPVK